MDGFQILNANRVTRSARLARPSSPQPKPQAPPRLPHSKVASTSRTLRKYTSSPFKDACSRARAAKKGEMKGCVSDAFVNVWEDRRRVEHEVTQERTARAVSLSHRAPSSREEEEKHTNNSDSPRSFRTWRRAPCFPRRPRGPPWRRPHRPLVRRPRESTHPRRRCP